MKRSELEAYHPRGGHLAISKLAAGREKDLRFVGAMFSHNLLKAADVDSVLHELDPERARLITTRLRSLRGSAQNSESD